MSTKAMRLDKYYNFLKSIMEIKNQENYIFENGDTFKNIDDFIKQRDALIKNQEKQENHIFENGDTFKNIDDFIEQRDKSIKNQDNILMIIIKIIRNIIINIVKTLKNIFI